MKKNQTERTEERIRKFAQIYDIENDSPFQIPDENICRANSADFLDDAQSILAFGKNSERSAGLTRASDLTADEPRTSEAKFLARVPPADNMGLAKYGTADFPRNWGGYDGGVEAGIDGEWDQEQFFWLCEALDACKQHADNGNDEGAYIDLGGFVWKVSPKGASAGFFKYKYVLESHGVKLYLHSNPKRNVVPLRVRFGFECLARTNLFEAAKTLRETLAKIGFTWERETLSRVDMQVLLPVDIYEFADAMKGRRVVTQCRGKCEITSDCHSLRIQTITLRSENAEVCIYDKLAQLEEADSVYYMTFHRWILNYQKLEHLTRVEFRFRRPMLRRYGITTFEDLRASQKALPQVFGRDWFRILEREKVRGSENVIKNAQIWDRTLRAFEFYFGQENGGGRSSSELREHRPSKNSPGVERLMKQAVGCIASVLAVTKQAIHDRVEVIQKAAEALHSYGDELLGKMTLKQIKNEVVHAFTPDNLRHYDCRDEIELALVSAGVQEYLKEW